VLLCHYGEHGPEHEGLTRRISARHAVIRQGRQGFEIEDVSRYGLLLDGAWPGKHSPVALRLGMRIELTASIKGVATLVVTALLPHAVVLHRIDAGGAAECIMLVAPDAEPAAAPGAALPRAAVLPLLFHRDGGFWHRDPASGVDTPLGPTAALDRLAGFHGRVRFTAAPYPEYRAARGADRRTRCSSSCRAPESAQAQHQEDQHAPVSNTACSENTITGMRRSSGIRMATSSSTIGILEDA
jgi:predicted component of type VI protein secretion system